MSGRSTTEVLELLKVFGVEPPVTWAEVEERRRTLVKVWHPDRFQNDPPLQSEAQEQLSRINVAFDELAALHRRGDSWWEHRPAPARAPREQPPTATQAPRSRHESKSAGFPLPAASARQLEAILREARAAKASLGGGAGKARKFFMWAVVAAVLLKLTGPAGALGFLLLAAVVGGFTVMGLAGRRERLVLSRLSESDMACVNCECRLIADYALGAESQLDCLITVSQRILATGACPHCGRQFAR